MGYLYKKIDEHWGTVWKIGSPVGTIEGREIMTEKDIFMAYISQIAELVVEMSMEEYEAWKREVREAYSEIELCFMEKIFMVTDQLVLT